jgi:uncharacterized protein with GYD domain
MARYAVLFNWTDQGIRNVRDTVDRGQQATDAFRSLGVTIETLYWTQGEFDLVGFVEAEDDKAVAAAMLRLGGVGNVRTRTLRAFDQAEMKQILQKAG